MNCRGRPRQRQGLVVRDTEQIVFDSHSATIYEFSALGFEVLAMCNGHHTLRDIQRVFKEKYGLSADECQSNVIDFVHQMYRDKIVDL